MQAPPGYKIVPVIDKKQKYLNPCEYTKGGIRTKFNFLLGDEQKREVIQAILQKAVQKPELLSTLINGRFFIDPIDMFAKLHEQGQEELMQKYKESTGTEPASLLNSHISEYFMNMGPKFFTLFAEYDIDSFKHILYKILDSGKTGKATVCDILKAFINHKEPEPESKIIEKVINKEKDNFILVDINEVKRDSNLYNKIINKQNLTDSDIEKLKNDATYVRSYDHDKRSHKLILDRQRSEDHVAGSSPMPGLEDDTVDGDEDEDVFNLNDAMSMSSEYGVKGMKRRMSKNKVSKTKAKKAKVSKVSKRKAKKAKVSKMSKRKVKK